MKVELSHDILARKVYERASADDKMKLKVEQFIKQRYAYNQLQSKSRLTVEDINYIKPYLDSVTLTPEERKFVESNQARIRRKKLLTITAAVAVFVIILALLIWSLRSRMLIQGQKAKLANANKMLSAAQQSVEKTAKQMKAQADSTLTVAQNNYLLKNNLKTTQEELEKTNQALQEAVKKLEDVNKNASSQILADKAKSSLEAGDKKQAFQLAKSAWEMNNDNALACQVLAKIQNPKVTWRDKLPKEEVMRAIKTGEKSFGTNEAASTQALESVGVRQVNIIPSKVKRSR